MRRLCLAAAPAAATVAVALGSPSDSAQAGIRPAGTHIAGTATLNASGTAIRLRGQVQCTGCTRFTLGVTVTQRRSGALGQGGVRCRCRSATTGWAVTTRLRGTVPFAPRRAIACGWVIAYGTSRTPIDAYQWCDTVTLVRTG